MDRATTKFVLLLLLLAGFVALFLLTPLHEFFSKHNLAAWRMWIADRGTLAPLAFLGVLALTAICGIPRMYPTILGGLLFPTGLSFVLAILGSTAGAVASFALARWMGREYVERRLGERSRRLRTLVERHGFAVVVALRLFPLSNFVLTNYLCGVAPIRFADYTLATLLGMIPSTLMFVLVGAGLGRQDVRLLAVATMLFVTLSALGVLFGRRLVTRPADEH